MKYTSKNSSECRHFPKKMGYIPSLDGLRAIAVIMVMLLHAHFQLGRNGGLGVDMFFALSGFLITTLLLEENRAANQISLRAFYIRRAFRLFPALYFMLSVILFYALFYTIGTSKEIILKEILASSLYIYNICWLWHCKPMIFGHTWSLGVEEQFYFICPLIIIIFLRFFSTYKLQVTLFFFIPIIWFLKFTNQFPVLNTLLHESLFIGSLFALLRWNGKFRNCIPKIITVFVFLILVVVGIFPIPYYDIVIQNNGRFILEF